MRVRRAGILVLLLLAVGLTLSIVAGLGFRQGQAQSSAELHLPIIRTSCVTDASVCYPVVFVSRQIPDQGSVYWDVPKDLPGVGPHSRFRVAAPGKLVIREPDGALRVLVDGSSPTAASFHLVDVNAPDVSYDGTKIAFAGLPDGSYSPNPVSNPGAWRVFTINVDGTDLQQVTFSDQDLDLSQFGGAAGGLGNYDDADPAWLPDGRIVFSSTRWPGFAQYSGVRASNLYVVDQDGSGLHRITSERNGADRPLVDPLTGKIVYARWWRNHRFAVDDMGTIPDPAGGYEKKDGLTADRSDHVGGPDNLWRNAWHAAAVNPDGTGLAMWSGFYRNEEAYHFYGGGFSPDGRLYANYYPMYNMTEAAGFGGIRRFERGAGHYEPVLGITYLTLDYVNPSNPTSYGIFVGNYATDAEVFPDGGLLLSWAPDIYQDYGLYSADADGGNLQLVYDNPGTSEIRARLVRPRLLPPVIPDAVSQVPGLLPPPEEGPYDQDGTFVFDARNVYFNAPVDWEIVSAIPVGSAGSIRFFIDHQRTSPGSFPNLDWPILLGELAVNPDGSVVEPNAPANVPLFEQIRSPQPGYAVPETGGPGSEDGAAHVTGMNFGQPGSTATCVGCHTGHTMIPVPEDPEAAKWTNLAPGAAVSVPSARDPAQNAGLIDRKVQKGEVWRYWTSAPGEAQDGQWVRLTFPAAVRVRAVRLYNPRFGDEAGSSLQVGELSVHLYEDGEGLVEVASQVLAGEIAVSGSDLHFSDVLCRVVEVRLLDVSGTFYGAEVAGLAEIEVIAKGE